MTRRCLALLLLTACAAPSAAIAQTGGDNPFGPLPQPQAPQPQAPAPQPVDTSSGNDDGLGGTAFWLLIGATGAVLVAVGLYIGRDMRRAVGKSGKKKRRRLRGTGRPAVDAAQALAEQPRHTPGSQKARAKAQKRSKTKAARKQRRKTRSR